MVTLVINIRNKRFMEKQKWFPNNVIQSLSQSRQNFWSICSFFIMSDHYQSPLKML